MMPAGACSQATFAAALLEPRHLCPGGLRVWNGSDPTARLAVYRNNVVGLLIDALADTFPVVQQLVGEEFFRAMAGVFVRQSPPQSRVLAFYGAAFAHFVEQFEPARPVPYLADVARLEFARVLAYHAADAEPVDAETMSLALASGERTGELRLVCHPSMAVVDSSHAVVSIWAAHQGLGDLAAVDPDQAEAAIVLRPQLDVLVLHSPAGAAAFVVALQQGQALGSAAASAAAAEPSFDLTGTLSLLLGQGGLTAIYLPKGPSHEH